MTATPTRRKPSRKPRPARPVTEILLELAYYLHTTHVVARPAKNRQRFHLLHCALADIDPR